MLRYALYLGRLHPTENLTKNLYNKPDSNNRTPNSRPTQRHLRPLRPIPPRLGRRPHRSHRYPPVASAIPDPPPATRARGRPLGRFGVCETQAFGPWVRGRQG